MSDTTPMNVPGGAIPPLMGAARQVWRDTGRVINALYDLFLIALAINVVCDLITFFAVRGLPEASTRALVISLLVGIVQALALTPYIIAIHRFIVLDEIAPSYFTHFGGERFTRFFGWSLGLTACFLLPVLLARALPLGEGLRGFVMLFLGIAAIMFGLRIAIMFPAIAVDAPGANLGSVMADTKGHAWRIFLLSLLVILPFIGLVIVLAIVFALIVGFAEQETVLTTALGSIIETVMLTAFVVLASRLFGWLAIQVRHA